MKTIMKAHPITGIGFLLLLIFVCAQTASAQPRCWDTKARIDYIIRDSKGHIIDASTLKPSNFVKESAPIVAQRYTAKISFSETGDAKDAAAVMALRYEGGVDCKFKLDELTLRMGGKTMHLIFNASFQYGSQIIIDSLPFKEGTFRLEDTSKNEVPASSWKKVSDKP